MRRRSFDFDWFKVTWLPGYGWTMARPPAVIVVPLSPDHRVWLAKMERPPTASASWELPGGGVDGDEDVVGAGLRELEEECGLVAPGGAWCVPAPLELAPGMGGFPHHVVIASGVVPKDGRSRPQREEGIVAVRSFDRAGIRKMIEAGRINVLTTVAGLAVSGCLYGPAPRRQVRRLEVVKPGGRRRP